MYFPVMHRALFWIGTGRHNAYLDSLIRFQGNILAVASSVDI